MSKTQSIAIYRQVHFILFCLITGNKVFIFNKPTYKQDVEQHVFDIAMDHEIIFEVVKRLRSLHIFRAEADKHFEIRDLN
jgi:hypothetical protein